MMVWQQSQTLLSTNYAVHVLYHSFLHVGNSDLFTYQYEMHTTEWLFIYFCQGRCGYIFTVCCRRILTKMFVAVWCVTRTSWLDLVVTEITLLLREIFKRNFSISKQTPFVWILLITREVVDVLLWSFLEGWDLMLMMIRIAIARNFLMELLALRRKDKLNKIWEIHWLGGSLDV